MIKRSSAESKYFNPESGEFDLFPASSQDAKVELSVIVPSYNEEERLPVMMDEALQYLEDNRRENKSFTYEIIVVDDGSCDQTTNVALKFVSNGIFLSKDGLFKCKCICRYVKEYSTERVRVLTLEANRGKGGAVRLGMLSARGRTLLMADADGATKFSDLCRLQTCLNCLPQSKGIAIGSRAHLVSYVIIAVSCD